MFKAVELSSPNMITIAMEAPPCQHEYSTMGTSRPQNGGRLAVPGMAMRVRSGVLLAVSVALVAAGLWLLLGWRWESLRQWFRSESPHQRYARSLTHGDLAKTAAATEWLAAARRAVEQPAAVEVPFAQQTAVDAARPAAFAYAVALERGQKVNVQVSMVTARPARLFIDLFTPPSAGHVDDAPLASAAEDATALSHEVDVSGTYTVRIQPELRSAGRARVLMSSGPSLNFPVSGGGARDMQSIFGAERDAGRRRHDGVDIFAPRGTPVLATSSGLVTRVGESRLGGRVVWVWDVSRGLTYYYAHLQAQLVSAGRFVQSGETLGTVGNTGNARTTAPHLHFGIYARGEGPIDPAPFIRPALPRQAPTSKPRGD